MNPSSLFVFANKIQVCFFWKIFFCSGPKIYTCDWQINVASEYFISSISDNISNNGLHDVKKAIDKHFKTFWQPEDASNEEHFFNTIS